MIFRFPASIGFRGFFLLPFLWFAGFSQAEAADRPLTLVEAGRPLARIVANGHDETAETLQTYIEKITGVRLPRDEARETETPLPARIELNLVETFPGTSDRPTALQAYRLCTEGNALRLEAVTPQGLAYAVWGLLEDHFGLCFPAPGREHIPERSVLRVGPLDELCEPAFVSRRAIDQRDTPWLLKNRGGGTPGLWSNHSFYRWIPPEKYFEEHPEWFALIDGERKSHPAMSLCGTDEDLARELARVMGEAMEKRDPDDPLRVGQGDGFAACQCDACRALVEREGTEAAPYLLMLNRALEITSKTHPRHKVVTFAYYGTLAPPATMRPHANLFINVVSTKIRGNADQLGPIRGNPANKDCEEAYRTWPEIAPERVSAWHWSVNFRALTTEWPNLFAMVDNFRFWREAGLIAAHPEGVGEHSGSGGNWMDLRRWLYLKLMWNPEADADTLIDTFLRVFYGPEAAPRIGEYLRFTHRAAVESELRASGLTDPAVLRTRLFTRERIDEMARLLEGALAAAETHEDPVYAERVTEAMATSIDVLRMLDEKGRIFPLHATRDSRDGSFWFVPEGNPENPARIDRISAAYRSQELREWAAGWFSRLRFLGYVGGRLYPLENEKLRIETAPNLSGRIVRLVYKPTGAELLASDVEPQPLIAYRFSRHSPGYADVLPARIQEWRMDEEESDTTALSLIGYLHRDNWWEMGKYHPFRRTVRIEDGAALTLERSFAGKNLPKHLSRYALPDPTRFSSRWRWTVADPAAARLILRDSEGEQTVNLNQAEPFESPVPASKGPLVLALHRGDGLVVKLETEANGWERVSVAPDPEGKRVVVTLVGTPRKMTGEDQILEDLPSQRISVVPDAQLP